MGLSESKKPYRRENSINPANGTDKYGCEISAYRPDNKSAEKSDVDMTVVNSPESKSRREVDQDKTTMNTVSRRRVRAVKLKRTCSKYTALDGKAANDGEIYDIDDQSEQDDNIKSDADIDTLFAFHAKSVIDRPDTCNEELEKDPTNTSGHEKVMDGPEERLDNCNHEYSSGQDREQRRKKSQSGRNRGHHHRYRRGFREDPVPMKNKDISNADEGSEATQDVSESTKEHVCHSRGWYDETSGKLSKKFAWPSSELLSISSIVSFENESTVETNDSYQLVGDYCANGNYVSTSISLPYNNLSIFSTDMKRSEQNQETDNDFSKTTHPDYYTHREAANDYLPAAENVSLESNVEYEMKSENTYRVVRYPLRIKVNPHLDVCEVSLPQRMVDELRVSRV